MMYISIVRYYAQYTVSFNLMLLELQRQTLGKYFFNVIITKHTYIDKL